MMMDLGGRNSPVWPIDNVFDLLTMSQFKSTYKITELISPQQRHAELISNVLFRHQLLILMAPCTFVNDSSRLNRDNINTLSLNSFFLGVKHRLAAVKMARLCVAVLAALLGVLSLGSCQEKVYLERAGRTYTNRPFRSMLTVSNGERFGNWTWSEMCPDYFFAVGFSLRVNNKCHFNSFISDFMYVKRRCNVHHNSYVSGHNSTKAGWSYLWETCSASLGGAQTACDGRHRSERDPSHLRQRRGQKLPLFCWVAHWLVSTSM